MLKITNLNEIQKISSPALKAHVEHTVQNWIEEYQIETLDEMGCFVILDAEEKDLFNESEMEFTEILHFGKEIYLHGVTMTGDCYGEDTYLAITKGGESNV